MSYETTGSEQYFVWKVTGGSYAAAGIVTGGDGIAPVWDSRTREGINKEHVSREGLIDETGSVQLILTPDGADLVKAVLDPATDPTWVSLCFAGDLGLGVEEHIGAYPTKASYSCGNGKALGFDLSWLGTIGATSPAAVALSDRWNWEDWEGMSSIAGADYGLQNLTLDVEFATAYSDDIQGRDTNEKRQHRGVVFAGISAISATVDILAPPSATDFRADAMANAIALSSVHVTHGTIPSTLTVTASNLKWDAPPKAAYVAKRGDQVVWTGTLSPRFLAATVLSVTVAP